MNKNSELQRQDLILREMMGIRSMKRGTVTHQRAANRQTEEEGNEKGKSYPVLTWKERGGRTRSMRLCGESDLAWAEQEIGNYHRYRALCEEYREIAERVALSRRELRRRDSQKALLKEGLELKRNATRK